MNVRGAFPLTCAGVGVGGRAGGGWQGGGEEGGREEGEERGVSISITIWVLGFSIRVWDFGGDEQKRCGREEE